MELMDYRSLSALKRRYPSASQTAYSSDDSGIEEDIPSMMQLSALPNLHFYSIESPPDSPLKKFITQRKPVSPSKMHRLDFTAEPTQLSPSNLLESMDTREFSRILNFSTEHSFPGISRSLIDVPATPTLTPVRRDFITELSGSYELLVHKIFMCLDGRDLLSCHEVCSSWQLAIRSDAKANRRRLRFLQQRLCKRRETGKENDLSCESELLSAHETSVDRELSLTPGLGSLGSVQLETSDVRTVQETAPTSSSSTISTPQLRSQVISLKSSASSQASLLPTSARKNKALLKRLS